MSRYLPEGRTGFFDIPVEKLFHGKSNGEIFKMICEDEVLRSSILSGINYFANSWDSKYKYFNDWSYGEYIKFNSLKYEDVVRWAIPAIRELKLIQLSDEFVKNVAAQGSGRHNSFIDSIPEKYKYCTIDSLDEKSRSVAQSILDGKSMALCTSKNFDNMQIAWAAARSISELGVRSVKLISHTELNAEFADNARSFGGTVKYINDNYTMDLDVLLVGGVDNLAGSDTQTKNFRYLLRQRYENKLQTGVFLNLKEEDVESDDDIDKYLGDAYRMFKDEKWPAVVVTLSGGNAA